MQVKSAARKRSAPPYSVLTGDSLTKSHLTTKTITVFIGHPSEKNRTSTVTPHEKSTGPISLLISHSVSRVFDRKVAARVRKTTETPYLIKKGTQFAEFSVVTPERSKFVKLLDTAILWLFPEGDPDLTTCLNE